MQHLLLDRVLVVHRRQVPDSCRVFLWNNTKVNGLMRLRPSAIIYHDSVAIRTQRIVGLHDIGGVNGRKVSSVDTIVMGDTASASHTVHTTVQNLKVNVFTLSIAIHPQDNKVDALGLILQMRYNGPLARLALDRSMK